MTWLENHPLATCLLACGVVVLVELGAQLAWLWGWP